MRDEDRYKVRLIDGVLYNPWQATGRAPDPMTIAHGLSNLCRYGGHVVRFYSVAEHSAWIALYLACGGSDNALFKKASCALFQDNCTKQALVKILEPVALDKAELALFGLVHDAPEGAGLVDVPTPIKRNADMSEYDKAHERCITWLCAAWAIQPPPWPTAVKETDTSILGAERSIRPLRADGLEGGGEVLEPWPGVYFDRYDVPPDMARGIWLKLFFVLKQRAHKASF